MKCSYFFLLLIVIFSCSKLNTKPVSLVDLTPNSSSLIVKTSNLESLKSSINNSDFLKRISNTEMYLKLEKKLQDITSLHTTGEVLICFSKNKNDSLDFAVITKYTNNLFSTDSIANPTKTLPYFKTNTVTKSKLGNQIYFSTVIDSTLVLASSKTLVDEVFLPNNKNNELKKIFNTTDKDKTLSIIVKPNNTFIKSLFKEDLLPFETLTKYLALDVDLNQNEIYFNGITKANDSTKNIINVFKNTLAQENKIQNITPSNSDGFLSFTFDDFETFSSNLSQLNPKNAIKTRLFDNIIEVGVIYEGKNQAIVLNSLDIISSKNELLNEVRLVNSYREVDIFSFSKPALFSTAFSPFINYKNANLYCILDNFIIFTNQIASLQNIISHYQNKTTLSDKIYFTSIKEKLSNASSLLQITNGLTLKSILNKNLKTNKDYNLTNYDVSAIQFTYDNNFAHVNGIIRKNKIKASLKSVSEELNIKLDVDLLNTPHFVKNHITKQKEIVVQDLNDNLYLISNKGKIIWKKQLEGAILGPIEQLDLFKNGRLQLAFVTPKHFYVLDRNGKDVNEFPIKFNDEITQPLAVFDYEKQKNYRFLITQGKTVLMLNGEGKAVKGFAFKSAKQNIVTKPEHLRIGIKDYIVIKTKNKLHILNRVGQDRVIPDKDITYSDEPVYLFNNKFITTSSHGNLITIDKSGQVSTKKLNLSKPYYLNATSKTLVTQSENLLSIKDKTIELDFGTYLKPNIFYIKDKIYIATTDLQSHKIYVLDSQCQLLPNFPVYGNSEISLDDIDKDANLEFVTKGENNSIILYQIN